MAQPVRVVVPIDTEASEAWSVAIAYAERIGRKPGSAVSGIVLLTHTKQQLKATSLATHMGDVAAKALLANRAVQVTSGLQLCHATEQTLRGFARGAVVIAYFADDKMLEKLDAIGDLAGVVAVPWLVDAIDEWRGRWNPTVHGERHSLASPLVTDPVVEKALSALTTRVNISGGALQTRDRDPVDETMRILRAKGHSFDPTKLKSWAIREGWNPGAAEDLAKIARRVIGLKAKPSLAKFHDPNARYERWTG